MSDERAPRVLTPIERMWFGLRYLGELYPEAHVSGYNDCVFVYVVTEQPLMALNMPDGWTCQRGVNPGAFTYAFATD